MLTPEQNKRLTEVGPGTPCGTLLRRYWQAVCPTGELSGEVRKKRVRILGEDLVIYRKDDGTFACVAEACPHRAASLYFGFIEPDGIRCCYHGWKYDGATGACLERPFEPAAPHAGIRLPTYPVHQLSGLLFVYMGPDPQTAPLLPRWDILAKSGPKKILVMPIHHCNWLQIQENTVDTVHTYYLHGHLSVVENLPTLDTSPFFYRPIASYDYAVSDYGVEKTLVYGGEHPETVVFPPMIFPNILRIVEGPIESLHFRVPVDDEHTAIIWIGLFPPGAGAATADAEIPYTIETDPPHVAIEDIPLNTFYTQDRVVWETQGAIADRTRETLGASDRGIVLFRRMLAEQIDRVERGEEPTVAVVRDPEKNRILDFDYITKSWILSPEVSMPVLSRRTVLSLIASVAGAAALVRPGAAGAADLVKVRAAALPIVDTAPLFAALEQGYFTAEGLDVTIAPEYTGIVGLSGAVAGGYDIVYTNVPAALIAIQQGIDLRFVGLASTIGPPDVTALLTRKGENLRGPKDFAGKTIGINGLKNLQWMVVRAWVKAGGLDPDQVTLRDVPFPQMLDALKNKQVDGIFAIEPFLSTDLQDPTIDVAAHPFDVLPKIRAAGWVATGDFVQKHPDLVKKFVTALAKGAQWTNANRGKEPFFKLVAGYTKLDPARVALMRITPAMTENDPSELRRVAQMMRETGLLTSTADPATKVYTAR